MTKGLCTSVTEGERECKSAGGDESEGVRVGVRVGVKVRAGGKGKGEGDGEG